MNKQIMQKCYGLTECHYDYKVNNPVCNEDEIVKTIFAPNPLTGFADNSLDLQLSTKTDKAIKEFLDAFNKPLPSVTGAPDDETALDTVQPVGFLSPEQIQDYYQSLSQIANEQTEETKEDN